MIKRIAVFIGGYGSGKTEVSINFAAMTALKGRTALIDLDFITPYFRSRDASRRLKEAGVELVAPSGKARTSDLPVMPAQIDRLIRDRELSVVMDIGGDNGIRVLGGIRDKLKPEYTTVLMVVNTKRPKTSTPTKILREKEWLESAGGVKVDAFVHNTHLGGRTGVADILAGQEVLRETESLCGTGIALTAVEERLTGSLPPGDLDGQLLPIKRAMLLPWDEGGNGDEKSSL